MVLGVMSMCLMLIVVEMSCLMQAPVQVYKVEGITVYRAIQNDNNNFLFFITLMRKGTWLA